MVAECGDVSCIQGRALRRELESVERDNITVRYSREIMPNNDKVEHKQREGQFQLIIIHNEKLTITNRF